MELVKIDVKGLENTYAVSVFEKEFLKAVNEPWLDEEPFKRYQKKLIEDLTVLEMEKEKAIDMPKSKIYAADTGTITDLLKNPTLVEEIK